MAEAYILINCEIGS